ncbi:MAG: hypothetical protein KKG47_05335 [Proteobacteria bacterium]|nr:hypothetical protein [Pseudomonadota bacterium]MBU1736899.1 hypothetical protein [Pseudomonadota bacterium]
MKEFDSKLIPILREGIEIIRMILFRTIQGQIQEHHKESDSRFGNMLAGAVLNALFAQANTEEPFASFTRENKALIDQEIAALTETGERVLIPLTDALRMQTICNRIERGEDADDSVLRTAEDRGLLLTDRSLPMPNSFLDMVRRLGSSHGLVVPPRPMNQAD